MKFGIFITPANSVSSFIKSFIVEAPEVINPFWSNKERLIQWAQHWSNKYCNQSETSLFIWQLTGDRIGQLWFWILPISKKTKIKILNLSLKSGKEIQLKSFIDEMDQTVKKCLILFVIVAISSSQCYKTFYSRNYPTNSVFL